jgi:hypothetical protein
VEDSLAGKHHLTAVEADRLRAAHEKVTQAQIALKAAHEKVAAAQTHLNSVGDRSKVVNDAITKAVGDQRTAVSPLQVAQAQLGDAWQKLAVNVGPSLVGLFTLVIRAVSSLVTSFIDAIGWLGRVGDAIMNSPIVGFIRMVSGFVGGTLQTLGNAVGFIGSIIPHFAAGGVVNPRPGGTLALLGEAGEREYVIPESRMGRGGGGGAVVVHSHLYLDGRELASALERPLGELINNQGSSATSFGGA